jgi:hypothetical protein
MGVIIIFEGVWDVGDDVYGWEEWRRGWDSELMEVEEEKGCVA